MTFTIDDLYIIDEDIPRRWLHVCIPKEMSAREAESILSLNLKEKYGLEWEFREKLGEVKCGEKPNHKHLVFSGWMSSPRSNLEK